MRRKSAALALLSTLLLAGPAHAEDARGTDDSKAMAEQLFQQGRALMDDGRAAEACPKFAESARLDVAPGTLFNLAECYEATGRFASAWVRYHEMEVLASRLGQSRRAAYATSKIAELEPKLSYLVIDVPSPAPGTVVRRDGIELGKAAWGTRLPVDAGPHEVGAEAPGMVPWRARVEVTRREERVRIPPFRGAAKPDAPRTHGNGSRGVLLPLGIGLLVTSGVATAGAVGFGIAAKVENDTARRDECGPTSCKQAGLDRLDRALTYANIGTAFVVGGVVTLAAGIVSLLLAPSGPGTGSRHAEGLPAIRF